MHNSLALLVIGLGLLAECYIARSMPPSALMIRRARQVQVSEDETDVNGPWERFIVPAPAVVSLLGQLMVISSKVDFSLVEYAPVGGFKYMRHPESYRASLVQVSNDGWDAFMNAHTNMEKMKLYMDQVPIQVKTVMKILANNSIDTAEVILPASFERIGEIGRICVELSNETQAMFSDVMSLLGELLEVTSSSQGVYEEKREEVDAQLNATNTQKQYLEHISSDLKNKQQDINEKVKKARDDYYEAVRRIPTGWKAFLLEIASFFVEIVTFGHGKIGFDDDGSSPSTSELRNYHDGIVSSLVQILINQAQEVKAETMNIFNGQINLTKGNLTDAANFFMMGLNLTEKMLSGESELNSQAVYFIRRGESICEELKRMDGKPAIQSHESDIEIELDNLLKDMNNMVKIVKTPTGSSYRPSGHYSGVGAAERYKADMAYANLKDEEARSDKIFDEVMENYEETRDFLVKLSKLNLKEINYKQIVEMLTKGIKLMGQIRTQWSNLVQFFTLVSIKAEYAMNETFSQFVETARNMESDKEDTQFLLGFLDRRANDINKDAYFLNTLSGTYYDVSAKYLMDPLAGLSQLLSAKDDKERNNLLEQLLARSDQAQNAIKEISTQKRERYQRLIKAREQELDDIIKKFDERNETR